MAASTFSFQLNPETGPAVHLEGQMLPDAQQPGGVSLQFSAHGDLPPGGSLNIGLLAPMRSLSGSYALNISQVGPGLTPFNLQMGLPALQPPVPVPAVVSKKRKADELEEKKEGPGAGARKILGNLVKRKKVAPTIVKEKKAAPVAKKHQKNAVAWMKGLEDFEKICEQLRALPENTNKSIRKFLREVINAQLKITEQDLEYAFFKQGKTYTGGMEFDRNKSCSIQISNLEDKGAEPQIVIKDYAAKQPLLVFTFKNNEMHVTFKLLSDSLENQWKNLDAFVTSFRTIFKIIPEPVITRETKKRQREERPLKKQVTKKPRAAAKGSNNFNTITNEELLALAIKHKDATFEERLQKIIYDSAEKSHHTPYPIYTLHVVMKSDSGETSRWTLCMQGQDKMTPQKFLGDKQCTSWCIKSDDNGLPIYFFSEQQSFSYKQGMPNIYKFWILQPGNKTPILEDWGTRDAYGDVIELKAEPYVKLSFDVGDDELGAPLRLNLDVQEVEKEVKVNEHTALGELKELHAGKKTELSPAIRGPEILKFYSIFLNYVFGRKETFITDALSYDNLNTDTSKSAPKELKAIYKVSELMGGVCGRLLDAMEYGETFYQRTLKKLGFEVCLVDGEFDTPYNGFYSQSEKDRAEALKHLPVCTLEKFFDVLRSSQKDKLEMFKRRCDERKQDLLNKIAAHPELAKIIGRKKLVGDAILNDSSIKKKLTEIFQGKITLASSILQSRHRAFYDACGYVKLFKEVDFAGVLVTLAKRNIPEFQASDNPFSRSAWTINDLRKYLKANSIKSGNAGPTPEYNAFGGLLVMHLDLDIPAPSESFAAGSAEEFDRQVRVLTGGSLFWKAKPIGAGSAAAASAEFKRI